MSRQTDLVVGFSDMQVELADKLIRAGLDVLITNQRSVDEIFATLRLYITHQLCVMVDVEVQHENVAAAHLNCRWGVGGGMNFDTRQRRFDIVLVVGAPLLLAIVELFHPHPDDVLKFDVQTWLAVHYLQILLFPLAAVAMAALVRDREDFAAALCRVAMFVFAVSYVAFDTAAGVVTGILVKAAHASGTPDAWRTQIDAVWAHPIMGGSPHIPAPFLAVLGSVALSIGAVAAAVSLKRGGSSWGPVALLGLSGFGIGIFKTHAWPGGPLTFGGIGIAAAWLLWERARQRHIPRHSKLN